MVARDVAFVVDWSVAHAEIVAALTGAAPLLIDAELFDVYQGKKMPAGKKSMAYHLTYRSDKKTLEAAEVDDVHAKICAMLAKKFGAEIRK